MLFIIGFLSLIAFGSLIWTIIQIVKPEWFYKAEQEANIKKVRPWWYLVLAVVGLVCVIIIWVNAIQLKLISVWIFTVILTLGSVKGIGIVFFYDKFSSGVTTYIGNIKENKKAYMQLVIGRGVLTVVAALSALYFAGVFGKII
jgi:hypothetical protein